MTIKTIITEPNEILRQVSKPVQSVGNEERKLMDDMLETMYEADGIGLAAIQVGVPKRIIIIDISKDKEEKSQVHVREINFFYMVERMRERIVFSNNRYSVNNTDIVFSEEEILKEIEKNPEKFSPNVITRCLYQEHILPNICYIGGPAEVTYWLEFKKFFDKYKINYPVVVPRDFVLLLTKRNQKTLTKYGIELSQLFVGKENVIETILNIYSDNKNNFDDEGRQKISLRFLTSKN